MNTGSKINCFVCDTILDNWEYQQTEVHPMNGLSFRTYGHYGSTIFDPMKPKEYLDIAICDKCILEKLHKVYGTGKKDIGE